MPTTKKTEKSKIAIKKPASKKTTVKKLATSASKKIDQPSVNPQKNALKH